MMSPLQAPLTESELLKQHVDTAVLSHAEHLMEEEKDEVKHMNHMVQYAKCVAIRDKQILVSSRLSQSSFVQAPFCRALPRSCLASCCCKTAACG
jgi:hypothetical protein